MLANWLQYCTECSEIFTSHVVCWSVWAWEGYHHVAIHARLHLWPDLTSVSTSSTIPYCPSQHTPLPLLSKLPISTLLNTKIGKFCLILFFTVIPNWCRKNAAMMMLPALPTLSAPCHDCPLLSCISHIFVCSLSAISSSSPHQCAVWWWGSLRSCPRCVPSGLRPYQWPACVQWVRAEKGWRSARGWKSQRWQRKTDVTHNYNVRSRVKKKRSSKSPGLSLSIKLKIPDCVLSTHRSGGRL